MKFEKKIARIHRESSTAQLGGKTFGAVRSASPFCWVLAAGRFKVNDDTVL